MFRPIKICAEHENVEKTLQKLSSIMEWKKPHYHSWFSYVYFYIHSLNKCVLSIYSVPSLFCVARVLPGWLCATPTRGLIMRNKRSMLSIQWGRSHWPSPQWETQAMPSPPVPRNRLQGVRAALSECRKPPAKSWQVTFLAPTYKIGWHLFPIPDWR